MAAKVLTIEAAKAARIDVIENGKYSQVVQVRQEEGVILISGAVPGKPGTYVVVRPAKKAKKEVA